jgi:hypothetical protein
MSISKSEVRAIKNSRYQYDTVMVVDENGSFVQEESHMIMPIAHDAPHAPNKNEAKMLRRLQAQTGLNEKELRACKKYRRALSDAQKQHGDGNNRIKLRVKRLLRECAKNLNLPVWDKAVGQLALERASRYAYSSLVLEVEKHLKGN